MKSIIYETTGRAREFSELALNLYNSCSHRCLYCFAPDVLHTERVVFYSDVTPRVTADQISADARRLQKLGEKRPVLLCFVSDPYQPAEAESRLTRHAIQALHAHGLKVIILTKGGKRAMRDFDLLGPGDAFATTLTCIDEETSRWWEPGAALPEERIESLIDASSRGIKTWVSLEPVLYPNATKQLILLTKEFVGHYKIGPLNYHPWARNLDWPRAARDLTSFMDGLGVRYYVKKDMAQYLGRAEGYWNREK